MTSIVRPLALVALLTMLLGLPDVVRAAGGAITIVHGSEPRSLNPPIDIVRTTVSIVNQIFDPVIGTDENLKLVPGLATEWRRTGETTWRFKLRQGVKFHNGEDFDADSVVATIEAYKTAKGQGSPTLAVVKEARAVDRHTVEITTAQPNATIPEVMTFMRVLPKGYYAQVGPEKFALKPVGTGPFEFVEWMKGSHVTLRAHAGYWRGAPKIGQVTFRWAPEASTRVAMLLSGQADLIVAVPAEMVDQIKSGGQRVASVQGLRKMFVELNTFKPPFNDVRLRRALAYAMNVDELVATVLAGSYVGSRSIFPRYFPSYDANVPGYAHDPAKAKSLMAEAGQANGFSFPFYYTMGRYALDKELAQALAGQLAKVGIRAELKGMETGAYFTLLTSQTMEGMHMLSYTPGYPHEDRVMRLQFYSKGLYRYGHTPDGDRMIEKATTVSDMTERRAAYRGLEKYLLGERVSLLPLVDATDLYGISKRLEWRPRPDEIADLHGASVK